MYVPGNQNSILIECALIGLYEQNSRKKAKREAKKETEKSCNTIYTRRKVQSNDQYCIFEYKVRKIAVVSLMIYK